MTPVAVIAGWMVLILWHKRYEDISPIIIHPSILSGLLIWTAGNRDEEKQKTLDDNGNQCSGDQHPDPLDNILVSWTIPGLTQTLNSLDPKQLWRVI